MSTIGAVIAGVLTFVFSQYVLRLVIEPMTALRKSIVSVSHHLLLHQRALTKPGVDALLAETLSDLAAELRANAELIPFYDRLAAFPRLGLVPRHKILDACHTLNQLSYSMVSREGDKASKNDPIKIREQYVIISRTNPLSGGTCSTSSFSHSETVLKTSLSFFFGIGSPIPYFPASRVPSFPNPR